MTDELLPGHRFTLGDVAKVRRHVADCVVRAGLDGPRSEDFVLAVHEVMCNAIRHGGGSGLVRVCRDDGVLRCEVTDHGPGLSQDTIPLTPPAWESGDSGRGLWLVRELTDSVKIGGNGRGAVVTLEIRLVPPVNDAAALAGSTTQLPVLPAS